jgi:hypothetical protein
MGEKYVKWKRGKVMYQGLVFDILTERRGL